MSLQCSDLNEVVGLLREIPCSNELTLLQVLLAPCWWVLGWVGTYNDFKLCARGVLKIF
jgi:hypothetical protein